MGHFPFRSRRCANSPGSTASAVKPAEKFSFRKRYREIVRGVTMSLKLVRRPKTPYWVMRGTVRGQSIEESTGVTDKAVAEQIRIKRENEILTESIWGKTLTVTFA